MFKAQEYTYRVFWSREDNAFIATVAEFPSLSGVGDTQSEALDGIVEVVRFVLTDMVNSREIIPAPLNARNYSGNIRLRMPKEQHRRVAIEAAEQGVSINQLLVSRI
ncbi:MAG TPA: toxin-antitoxin system HicB family antitoxin [Coriobacteriia bacterium]|nr:toxin-antitoxin system HicB family antitoxin [Coriobacteriia bacterium]